MDTVTQSLWLPISRANFYNTTGDSNLLVPGSERCRSKAIDEDAYIPHLRASVMRRLLEVLPRSFGYEREGLCERSDEMDNIVIPTSITMRLAPSSAVSLLKDAVAANTALQHAGVSEVELKVDENGGYTFTATYGGGAAAAGSALREHIVAVFGGRFTVERLKPSAQRGFPEGAAAINRYNGMREDEFAWDESHRVSQPLGILSFVQLNILVEGLCNQALLPSVFFERYKFAWQWLAENPERTSVLTTLAQVIEELITDGAGSSTQVQARALHRFLIVSRESLQRLKRSVGSVRRQLLDAMMPVLHRQARLVQLDLGAVDYEATPELTGPDATESQMRGYVMLIAVKMPLIDAIAEAAAETVAHHQRMVDDGRAVASHDKTLISDLRLDLDYWCALLVSLHTDVTGLEGAVGHDWQERMLYEQEQSRSEQEAIAEIERGRRGRPDSRQLTDSAYTAINLFLTGAGLVILLRSIGPEELANVPLQALLLKLWPVAVFSLLIFLAAPALNRIRRLRAERKPHNETYSFEFAFRIDEPTSPAKVSAYFAEPAPKKTKLRDFGKARVKRLGGWRIEQASHDRTLLKAHSIIAVKMSRFRYARFEIVTEVVARKIAESRTFHIRQCRMFGDSPRPLPMSHIAKLVRSVLEYACQPLAEEKIDFDAIVRSTHVLCTGKDDSTAAIPRQTRGADDVVRGPGQTSAFQ